MTDRSAGVPEISVATARRIALAAGGFGTRRGGASPTKRSLVSLVNRLGVVQVDSVNVLARAHYLPAFSRLGGYDRATLDGALAQAPRQLFEYWGHEASLLPVSTQPLLRWRMARVLDDAWGGMVRVQREHPAVVREVAQCVRAVGPVTISGIEAELAHEHPRPRTGWGWNWSVVKRAVEYLFWAGEISSAGRDATFRRRYAATESVLPAAVLASPTPTPADAQRELVAIAARAMGIATAADLADYFRLDRRATGAALADLVHAGELKLVSVPGWPATYLSAGARIPRKASATALLAPFDPLIWFRPRVQRLFGMRYRVEIYVPRDQRQHGYYVLPFLFGEHLVARVDLKADRASGRLVVAAAHPEPDMPQAAVAGLAAQLSEMAGWLGLGEVEVRAGSPLAEALAGVLP